MLNPICRFVFIVGSVLAVSLCTYADANAEDNTFINYVVQIAKQKYGVTLDLDLEFSGHVRKQVKKVTIDDSNRDRLAEGLVLAKVKAALKAHKSETENEELVVTVSCSPPRKEMYIQIGKGDIAKFRLAEILTRETGAVDTLPLAVQLAARLTLHLALHNTLPASISLNPASDSIEGLLTLQLQKGESHGYNLRSDRMKEIVQLMGEDLGVQRVLQEPSELILRSRHRLVSLTRNLAKLEIGVSDGATPTSSEMDSAIAQDVRFQTHYRKIFEDAKFKAEEILKNNKDFLLLAANALQAKNQLTKSEIAELVKEKWKGASLHEALNDKTAKSCVKILQFHADENDDLYL